MRALKNLFTLAIIVVILAGGAAAAFRIARGRPSVPEQIKPGVVAVSSAGAYLYAAKAGGNVVLFDAGADPAGRPIDVAVAALNARRGDITDLFLTHGHPDHIAGRRRPDRREGAPGRGRRRGGRGARAARQAAGAPHRQGRERAARHGHPAD